MCSSRVLSRFTAKRRDGTVLKLRIQDVPSDRLDDVLDFNLKYFITEESLQRCTGMYKSQEALKECRKMFGAMIREPTYRVSICCLDNDTAEIGELIGVAGISLKSREDHIDFDELREQAQLKEIKKLLEMLGGMSAMYSYDDIMKQFDVEKYNDGRGVTVHPNYRGLGIATEFLRTRRMICKELGVPLTVAWMTSLGTQKAAERDGWQTLFEVTFDELAQRFGVTFDNAPTTCKLMGAETK